MQDVSARFEGLSRVNRIHKGQTSMSERMMNVTLLPGGPTVISLMLSNGMPCT